MLAQAAVNTGEAYFVGWLGPEALAGVSLVFPLIMLMQGMAGGGMGGAGPTLEAALTYSNLVFVGALSCWLLNTLASIVRGTGTMLLGGGSCQSRSLAGDGCSLSGVSVSSS